MDDESEASPVTPTEEDDYDEEEAGRQSPQSEDSSDKIPVKLSPEQRAHRSIVNCKVEADYEEVLEEQTLPGVVRTQAHFERQKKREQEKEAGAAVVIQKFFRGKKGRKLFRRQ